MDIVIRARRAYRIARSLSDLEAWFCARPASSFEAREGGAFRISLTYDSPTQPGKTTTHTEPFQGRFMKLVPNEEVVEQVEFESADPAMQGEMTITYALREVDGGTELFAVHEGLPPASRRRTTRWAGDCRWESSRRSGARPWSRSG